MKVFRVPQGTMPEDLTIPKGYIPSFGSEGRRNPGGDKPKTPTPIRAYERIEVFGLQCNPKTITGNTRGDPIWHGGMSAKQRREVTNPIG